METCKLCFLLLLLTNAEGSRERFRKTLHHQPDVTPVCRNDSSNIILLTVCFIHTEGGPCRITFRPGRSSDHECGSKFQMKVENQTVFLQLSSLGEKDSGNGSCECSRAEGTTTVELDFTVVPTGNRSIDSLPKLPNIHIKNSFRVVLILVLILVLAAGVLLFLASQRRRGNGFLDLHTNRLPSRRQQGSNSSLPVTVVEDIEPYDMFLQKENVLYLSSRAHSCNTISSVLT